MNGRNGGQNISKVFERCKIASNKCKARWQNMGINLQNQSISWFSKQSLNNIFKLAYHFVYSPTINTELIPVSRSASCGRNNGMGSFFIWWLMFAKVVLSYYKTGRIKLCFQIGILKKACRY